MVKYIVSFQVEVEAETPEEAAKKADVYHNKTKVFSVEWDDGFADSSHHIVDLTEGTCKEI